MSVPVAQVQRTQIDIRFVDAGCSQAACGLSSARPGVHRVMHRLVVGAGASRRREGRLRSNAAVARMKLGIFLSSSFSGEGASFSPTSIGRAPPDIDATIGTMHTPAHHANGCFFLTQKD